MAQLLLVRRLAPKAEIVVELTASCRAVSGVLLSLAASAVAADYTHRHTERQIAMPCFFQVEIEEAIEGIRPKTD